MHMNKKYFIEWEGQLRPLKKWILQNNQLINGYVYNEKDITHRIEDKLEQLGWNSIYDDVNHWQVLTNNKPNQGLKHLNGNLETSNSRLKNSSVKLENNVNEFNNFISNYEKTPELEEIRKNLDLYLTSYEKLKSLGVITNRRDFTSQIGEWFVSNLTKGKISSNGIQKDWDLIINDSKIQVKSHSKASTTSARWSSVKNYNKNSEIDYLAILVFDVSYKIQDFYFLSWHNALNLIRVQKHDRIINWSDLNEYKVDLKSLKDSFLIKMFLR